MRSIGTRCCSISNLPLRAAASLPRVLGSRSAASAASPQAPKKLLVLEYAYDAATADELVMKRAPLRGAHLTHAASDPAVVMGGAFSEPPMGAQIVFEGATRDHVEQFARTDPYVTGKLVSKFAIREWIVVLERRSP